MSSDTEPAEPLSVPDTPSKPSRETAFSETTNKNVEWISSPGAWTFYLGLISLSWLVSDLSWLMSELVCRLQIGTGFCRTTTTWLLTGILALHAAWNGVDICAPCSRSYHVLHASSQQGVADSLGSGQVRLYDVLGADGRRRATHHQSQIFHHGPSHFVSAGNIWVRLSEAAPWAQSGGLDSHGAGKASALSQSEDLEHQQILIFPFAAAVRNLERHAICCSCEARGGSLQFARAVPIQA